MNLFFFIYLKKLYFRIPPQTAGSKILVMTVKLSMVGLLCYGCYKILPKVLPSRLNVDLSALRKVAFSR